jgi:hypothetical protein
MTGMAAYTPGKGSGNTRQESLVRCPYVVCLWCRMVSVCLHVFMSLCLLSVYALMGLPVHVSALLTCMRFARGAFVACAHGRVRATVPGGIPSTRGTLR